MFENRLNNIREEKKLSRKDTAQSLGLPYTTYIGYEKDEREPNSETLIKIAKFFDVSVDYLLGRTTARRMVASQEDKVLSAVANWIVRVISNTDAIPVEELKLLPEVFRIFMEHSKK